MEQTYAAIGFAMAVTDEDAIAIRFRVPDQEAQEGWLSTPAIVLPGAVAAALCANLESLLQHLPDSAFPDGIRPQFGLH